MSEPAPFVLVVSLQPLDATTSLFFGHLLDHSEAPVRVTHYGGRQCVALLSRASAVIFVRGLFECADLARGARTLGIPVYYFLDDNFMVLREQGGREAEFVGDYSIKAVRAALRNYAGVLLSSAALINYFRDHALHERLMLFPPVASPCAIPAPATRSSLHLAFFGGRHLHGMLHDVLLPAIRRLARRRPVTMTIVGVPASLPESEGLTIVSEAYRPAYDEGMQRLVALGVDVLVHPSASGMANNAYKNPHALISARRLGAVPVVSNVAPYAELCGNGVAICCGDSSESWYDALAGIADDPDKVAGLRARLDAYCEQRFSGTSNRELLRELVDRHAAPRPAATLLRFAVLQSHEWRRLAKRIARRLLPARTAA